MMSGTARTYIGAPPPARGELDQVEDVGVEVRSTPACAGRTPWWCSPRSEAAEHPRLRGENRVKGTTRAGAAGAPPPARGEPLDVLPQARPRRSTPACAGRTRGPAPRRGTGPEHPRLRGENLLVPGVWNRRCGAPPPARGELWRVAGGFARWRSTPACAGRTRRSHRAVMGWPEHPRLRGENVMCPPGGGAAGGAPPPARGEREDLAAALGRERSTPACAGRTESAPLAAAHSSEHPRLRGENQTVARTFSTRYGAPPPARGEQGPP